VSNGIIAHIWCNGDSDAGIEGVDTNLNTCLTEFKDVDHRNTVRHQLENCFSQLWEQHAKVLFTDEFSAG
jgi:hypothetical protein